jgi:hypothetical protein
MDDLTYELRQLCRRNRDNSHKTQANRLSGLTLIGRQLRELGFRNMRASSLKGKHVEALLARWEAEDVSDFLCSRRVVLTRVTDEAIPVQHSELVHRHLPLTR